jgi:putative flippase GtrA
MPVYKADMIEAIKFVATGVTNTAVDFGVLNLLIVLFGITQGDPKFILFKAISYVVAATNSFFLNKLWVFKNRGAADTRQVGTFAAVNVAGLVINTLISLVVFHTGTLAFPTQSAQLWANAGALCGTAVVLLFNFFSYKFIVFNK